MKTDNPGFVYVLQMEGHPYYKIGRTVSLTRRVAEISPQMPGRLQVINARRVGDCAWAEKNLHNEFQERRLNGEWFDLDRDCLTVIEAALLFCQADTTLGRLLHQLKNEEEQYLPIQRIEKYGRAIALAARRSNRRLDHLLDISFTRRISSKAIPLDELETECAS